MKGKDKNLKVMAVIGARSGSKGLPHKNIRLLAGKPLMAWIIEAALGSRYINRVIVSTDSEIYAEIAKAFGAEVPFFRPKELAQDRSPEFEFVKHAVDWLRENENYQPDFVVRLHPTSPLQTGEDIDKCVEILLSDPSADSAVVIAEARQHPHKALKLVPDGQGGHHLKTYITESGRDVTPLGRQSYEKAFFRANLIASRLRTIEEMASLTGDVVRHYLIPQLRTIDIDSDFDFFIAEQLIKKFKNP